jgi:osmotically inducible protein OsmC
MTQLAETPTAPGAETLIYTAKTHTYGGREGGVARSADGRLHVKLSAPGGSGSGTNPEQLFAAGWSACFESAIGIAAVRRRLRLHADIAIDAEVDLNKGDGGYFLRARLDVSIPGVDRIVGQTLLDEAETLCPYSKAVRGNIEVVVTLI